MEKNIKDYLHLYLGCECAWEHHDGNCGGTCELDIFTLERFYDGEIKAKPILRPLSSMNDGEMNECGNMDYDFSDDPELNTWTPDSFFLLSPNQFIFLLSKHFDLFDLIDAGLAIDKTAINQAA